MEMNNTFCIFAIGLKNYALLALVLVTIIRTFVEKS